MRLELKYPLVVTKVHLGGTEKPKASGEKYEKCVRTKVGLGNCSAYEE